jgi:hypothetical protein
MGCGWRCSPSAASRAPNAMFPHPLALPAFVPQRIASAFADRLALPLAHRAHDSYN